MRPRYAHGTLTRTRCESARRRIGDDPSRVVEHLRARELLLVLDNVEQVIAVAPLVAVAPRLRVLATSRAALRIRAEQQFRVPPLAIPDARPAPTVADVAGYAAVQLFVSRARAVQPRFALDEANAGAVAEVCRRLDGLPLAIELATARVTLPPAALAARLERRLLLLTGGARDLPERQQTLRATVDWSYDLLTAEEQRLFRRLAVFAGGRQTEAPEAVCGGADARPGLAETEDVLDGVASLLDKSLLRADEGEGGMPRVGMLETIREYGLHRLEAAGEAAALRRRHMEYFLALAEAAEPLLTGPAQETWLTRLEEEHDNLRAALRWAWDNGETTRGMRLASTLWRFWYLHGYLSEGRTWLEEGLSLIPIEAGSAALRAKALTGAGVLAYTKADYERTATLCEDSLTLFQALGDKRGAAVALNILGNVAMDQGDDGRAVTLSEVSLALHREMGDRRGIAVALNNLGVLMLARGGDARAVTLCEESLALSQSLGDTSGISSALNNLADASWARGDYGRAASLYEECVTMYYAMGDKASIAGCLADIAEVARARGEPGRAARLYGAAARLRDAIGAPLPAASRVSYERSLAALRTTLGEQAFAEAWVAGAALSLDQAVDEARATALSGRCQGNVSGASRLVPVQVGLRGRV